MVRVAEWAVFTVRCRGRVVKLTGSLAEVRRHVVATCLASRWVEDVELRGRARHRAAVESGGSYAVNDIGQWGYPIHEDPETGQCLWGLHDTVKGQGERKKKRCDVAGCFCVGKCSDEHVCKGRSKDEELDAKQEDEALAFGRLDTIDWVVVGAEYKYTQQDLIRNFDHNVCD